MNKHRLLKMIAVGFLLACVLDPGIAVASDGYIRDWTANGTCEWSIDSDGALVVRPADGADYGELDKYGWGDYDGKIKSVSFEGAVRAMDCACMFKGCSWLRSADLTGLETSSSVDAERMFSGCSRLTSVTLPASGFEASNLQNMFSDCSSLTSVDLSGLETPGAVDAEEMFCRCSNLASVTWPTSGFKVSNAASMFYCCDSLISTDLSGLEAPESVSAWRMFYSCLSLVSVDLSGFEASGAVYAGEMFYGCSKLASVTLPTSGLKISSAPLMFSGCSALTSVDLSCLETSENILSAYGMFYECSRLVSVALPASGFKVSSANSMFYGCSSLASIDLSGLQVFKPISMRYMFNGCSKLTAVSLPVSGLEVSDISGMFGGCSSLASIDLSGLEIPGAISAHVMFSGCKALESVTWPDSGLEVSDIFGMFSRCSRLRSVDLSGLKAPGAIDASCMFHNCSLLTSVTWPSAGLEVSSAYEMFSGCLSLRSADLSGLKTPKAVSAYSMFSGCTDLTSVTWPSSGFKTSELCGSSAESGMFSGCSSLVSADLSGLETPEAVNARYMFSGCSKLISVIWPTSGLEVSSASDMFSDCLSLTSIDLSGLIVSSSTNMMFSRCSSLTFVDLSGLETPEAVGAFGMFYECSNLVSVTRSAPGFKVSYANDMFSGCSSLTSVDLSGLETPEAVDASGMFYECSSLASVTLPVSGFKVSSESTMFYRCSSLASLDLSGLDNSTCKSSASMFKGMGALREIKVSENFAFQSALPVVYGKDCYDVLKWSDDDGNLYSSGAIPSNVATTYRIVSAILSKEMFEVDTSSHQYLGEEIKPVVKAVVGYDLIEGNTYEVEYDDNLNAGTATICVKGKGSFGGRLEYQFEITKASAKHIVPTGLSAFEGQTLADVALPEGFNWDDPSLSVGDPGDNEFTCSWIGDVNHEGTGGINASVHVSRPINPSMFTVNDTDLIYTGEPLVPVIASDVVPEDSYSVSYLNNINAGAAKVSVTGTGLWGGSCELEFQIAKAPAVYDVPTDLTAEYGQALADVVLPEGFSWDDPSLSVGGPGDDVFTCSWAGDANHEGAAGLKVSVHVSFTDVPSGEWYAGWVAQASSLGLMTGTKGADGGPTGRFEPQRGITRAEVATVLWRMSGSPSAATAPLSDIRGHWAEEAVSWCYAQGVITGYTDGPNRGRFLPDGQVTREELATMAYRAARRAGADVSAPSADAFASCGDTGLVSAWSRDAMVWCASAGVLTGVQGGARPMLAPRDGATRAQAAKIFTVLKGVCDSAA